MARWRYLAYKMNGDGTQTLLDPDLPLQGVKITNVLSGPGSLQAGIAPAVARLLDSAGDPVIRKMSTAIFAEEDDVIRSGAIVTSLTRDPAGANLSIDAVGFTGIIKGQPYDGSIFFVEAEPLDIVRHIWTTWQAQKGGNLGLVVDAKTKTGKKIGTKLDQVEFDTQAGPVSFEAGPYKLNEWETHDLGGNIDTLAADQGFDYMESHRWSSDKSVIEHHLDFGAPRIGTRRNDLRFVVGENIMAYPNESDDPASYASEVLVLGAGEGRTMIRKRAVRSAETRLRSVAIVTDTQIKTSGTALSRAQTTLPFLTGETDIGDFAVLEHTNAPIGSWKEGDEVEVIFTSEWGDDAFWVRILSTTFNPEDLSVASVAVVRADKIPS